jgi:hypothetical protein
MGNIITKELLPFRCGIIAARSTKKEVTDTIFRERQRMIPHRERRGMTRKRVLHREMELISLLPPLLPGEGRGEVKKIDRSAEALRVCHHPTTFPSEKNFASKPGW